MDGTTRFSMVILADGDITMTCGILGIILGHTVCMTHGIMDGIMVTTMVLGDIMAHGISTHIIGAGACTDIQDGDTLIIT